MIIFINFKILSKIIFLLILKKRKVKKDRFVIYIYVHKIKDQKMKKSFKLSLLNGTKNTYE